MIFHLILLTTTSLFSQVKCRTYVPEKDFVDHNLNRRQTNNLTHNPTYNPAELRQIIFENIMKGDRSPIIFTDKGPVTINYRGIHRGPGQPPDGFKNSYPIVMTSQGEVTVNYDDSQDDAEPPNNQDICQLTNTMVELPSGIVLPYIKFKTISPYLLAEDQKSDIRVVLDNKNMTYKQFQETLRYYGCGDLEDSPRPSEISSSDHVTLANGTLKAEMDDYRNIVSSITSGSETLMVPNVVSGKYSLYRSLIADELPELIGSAFVITHEGIVVPFSLYYAVDREHFQRPPTAAVVPCKVRQIKWRDGKLVDVQTVRHVIDALRTPTMISFVFPNGKRMPFVRCSVKEPTESYDYDPEKVMVDVGQCKDVLLSHFNDILKAVRIPDDDCKNKRFNPPTVFALDPKCLNTTDIYNVTDPVNPQTNNITQNNTELMNTTTNPSTCEKMDNITTIESKNNATENPDCGEIYIKNQQNSSNPNLTSKNTTASNTTTTSNPNQATMTSNHQNSSNPVIGGNTIPITTAGNNNQTETKNTTIISAPSITQNTTDSNNTNTDKIYEPNDTSNNTVTTETSNNTTTDPNHNAVVTENRQNGSNPVNRTNEIPAVTNTNHYQNPTETINTTASTSNYTENTKVGSNAGGKDNDSGSNETPSVNNTAETIQTSGATRASDAADDVEPMENGEKIPETNTGINDETSNDALNITTTGKTETNQPTPIYTETIKSPNNNSVTNNATKIINIIVY
ncbi:uncharacterized protein LOC132950150 [Metopolophium dirhodum]|uniref:uncharacterized protein LOC132950150 n=1 Tax=Metopolophium dirhodum TaxID=44670 RepID=UPI00298F7F2A|nr:uncharacterized protein LOC132950150 [Metopolophium dirhodum]